MASKGKHAVNSANDGFDAAFRMTIEKRYTLAAEAKASLQSIRVFIITTIVCAEIISSFFAFNRWNILSSFALLLSLLGIFFIPFIKNRTFHQHRSWTLRILALSALVFSGIRIVFDVLHIPSIISVIASSILLPQLYIVLRNVLKLSKAWDMQ